MFNAIIKMVFNIKDVVVGKISLITRGKRPAVPTAETRFSIFKMETKKKLSQENITKLDEISKAYTTKTLYVSRHVQNAKDIIKRAKDNGIKDIISAKEMHLTVAFSKKKVDWSKFTSDDKSVDLQLQNATIEKLGDAIVISFKSKDLEKWWKKYVDGWASWDFETYTPHISLSYTADQDISNIGKYSGPISLGKEVMAEVNTDFVKKLEDISKKYDDMIKATTTTHTLLFDKKKFSKQEALDWAKSHDFKYNTIRETENQWRVRQIPPEKFNQDSFRTIKLRDGVEAVIWVLK